MSTSQSSDLSRMVIRLAVTPGRVTGEALLSDRLLRQLVVEDACWKRAQDAWRLSRPPWWHRDQRRRWRSEGAALEVDRQRFAALACRCGVAH